MYVKNSSAEIEATLPKKRRLEKPLSDFTILNVLNDDSQESKLQFFKFLNVFMKISTPMSQC